MPDDYDTPAHVHAEGMSDDAAVDADLDEMYETVEALYGDANNHLYAEGMDDDTSIEADLEEMYEAVEALYDGSEEQLYADGSGEDDDTNGILDALRNRYREAKTRGPETQDDVTEEDIEEQLAEIEEYNEALEADMDERSPYRIRVRGLDEDGEYLTDSDGDLLQGVSEEIDAPEEYGLKNLYEDAQDTWNEYEEEIRQGWRYIFGEKKQPVKESAQEFPPLRDDSSIGGFQRMFMPFIWGENDADSGGRTQRQQRPRYPWMQGQ